MPLSKLVFKPGVNRDQTNYSSEGGYYAMDMVRFRSGFPEKIGGWQVDTTEQYAGSARSIFPWVTSNGIPLFSIGTNTKVYIQTGTVLNDITPTRAIYTSGTTPSTDNIFSTTISSTTVLVTMSGHGAIDGDSVIFSGAVAVGGVVAADLNTGFIVSNVTSTTFTITVANAATSTVSGGGGTGITAAFDINVGYSIDNTGYGWGTGGWGSSGWGSSSTTPVVFPARLIFFDKINDTLIFNVSSSYIYYWIYDDTFATRATLLSTAPGAIAVPQQVTKTMFASSGHLLALGCTAYLSTEPAPDYLGVYDPLLVRWANVDATIGPQPEVWQPTLTNTAGFLRLQSGNKIVTGIRSRQEVLIWTDSTLNSLQFLGTSEVFSTQEISATTTIAGPNVVASANNVVYWMGRDKFYMYSGKVDTLPCTLRQYIFDDINHDQDSLFFAGTNNEFNEVVWFYCSSTANEIDRYVIFNYEENIWYYGLISRTAWVDASGINSFPVAASNGWIYSHENGHDDGQPLGAEPVGLSSYIQSAFLDVDDGDHFMLIRRVIPDVNFTNSDLTNSVTGDPLVPAVDMTISVSKFPGAAPSTTNAAGVTTTDSITTTATIDLYTNQVFIRARGRAMAFKISSDMVGVQWQLGSNRIDARVDGLRG